jgi:hypothetical protein
MRFARGLANYFSFKIARSASVEPDFLFSACFRARRADEQGCTILGMQVVP